VLLSDSGFINGQLAIRWLEHFVEYTAPHEETKVLLLDSHVSHISDDSIILAAASNVIIYAFPSHLTHILQPLDVGIFQPYKHWYREAVLAAIREMDLEYSLRSFMRDLSQIREQTFKGLLLLTHMRSQEYGQLIVVKLLRSYVRIHSLRLVHLLPYYYGRQPQSPLHSKLQKRGYRAGKTKFQHFLVAPRR
jgi:hypothetical protein